MKKIIITVWSLVFGIYACNDDVDRTIAPDKNDPVVNQKNVTIDISKTYQTIESFSASDCWLPNYIGKYWTETEKEGIAKLLFSREIKNGKPEGIGLSGWRFNLGGGTAQQGANSGIEDVSRRAESFMDPTTGIIDWTMQSGQQYFLDKAKSYGCEQFVMFSNTPPVYMTQNGKGFSAKGAYSNLNEESYDDFAKYIADVIKYFKNEKGINFSFISPVNEPQYNWESGQEGTGWQNSEIAKLSKEINSALENNSLDTKILLSEAAAWNYLYENDGDAGRKNVISNLFSSSSANYVGDLSHVAPIIAGHSYWTDGTWSNLTSVRTKLNEKAKEAGLKVYQTEWSMIGDGYNNTEFVGFNAATYMDIALYMSKVIHCDLVYANVSSWSYWTSVDLERWDHKNRFLLISAIPASGVYGDITQSGTHEAKKSLWVLGNYSLFIKPDYQRVDIEIDNTSNTYFGSAYISPDQKTLVCVYTNLTSQQQSVNTKLVTGSVKSIKSYTTSPTQDLEEKTISDLDSTILINPNSVVSLVCQLN